MTSGQDRLDAFTDAAFAFAVTLMVAGTGGMAPDYRQLEATLAGAPSFVIAFAIIAMFWLAHVRARRNPALDAQGRREAYGQVIIWAILAATGIVSTGMTFFRATVPFAPMVYATLPLTIGLFAARYRWAEPTEQGHDA
ncbi:hypothetical protein BWQ93_00600 [Sphingopyxis sp. QXT-31]|uniref:TMEM175 family protein n=1 Tax=Sphingopyxis sp. QXT-31 TaxID=1357916 RepID=UPI00097944D8|nr:TMEM175 family protein [Sphingopyxis sp. QXT-31]APZ97158.1 hypothetical protein BWQ93_00600 [Sphingopyxis sp. QXT-31]